ncbi:Tumour protein D52 family [Nesidiocoris tenuis]|uniref:Tumour protein D52 family n=1 Tax=Nesidiocoris tenuis TaxID=355587 RepID=A0ABN7AM49_9HEMI|nr:Tumour protein D52 family [Nesidiocoris tenuis]
METVNRHPENDDEPEDFASLEYEEDCYYAFVDKTETPSFDVDDAVYVDETDPIFNFNDEFEPSSLPEIPENFTIETEFYDKKLGNNKFIRAVRVKFHDLSKPYFAKVTSEKNYTKFLQIVNGEKRLALVKRNILHPASVRLQLAYIRWCPLAIKRIVRRAMDRVDKIVEYIPFIQKPLSDMSPDSGINELAGLTPEEQEKQKQEWASELAQVEEEINTLKLVLSSKVRQAQELKRKLGFSVWRDFQDDMQQGIKNVKESNIIQSVEEKVEQIGKAVTEAPLYQSVEEKVGQISKAVIDAPLYQKTESVIKATTEKTTSILGGIGSGLTSKIGQLKNSESFKSFEEKVGSAYENVKTKVSTSRSSSMQSFDDALREAEGRRMTSPATTPTIKEDAPL